MKGFWAAILMALIFIPSVGQATDATVGGVGFSYEKWQASLNLNVCNVGFKLDMSVGVWIRFSDNTGCDVTAQAFRALGSDFFGPILGGIFGGDKASIELPNVEGEVVSWGSDLELSEGPWLGRKPHLLERQPSPFSSLRRLALFHLEHRNRPTIFLGPLAS